MNQKGHGLIPTIKRVKHKQLPRPLICLALLSFTILLDSQVAYSQKTPEIFIASVIAEIKSESSLGPILTHVAWENAFNEMSPEERQQNGISSPEQLREHEMLLFLRPAEFAAKQLSKEIQKAPPERKSHLAENGPQIEKSLVAQMNELNRAHQEAKFEIEQAKQTGDTAQVILKSEAQGKSSSHVIELLRNGDSWYFARFQPFITPNIAGFTPPPGARQQAIIEVPRQLSQE